MSFKSILIFLAIAGVFAIGFLVGYTNQPQVAVTYSLLVGILSVKALILWLLLVTPLEAAKHTLITMASVVLWTITGTLLAHAAEFSLQDALVTAFYMAFALFGSVMELGAIYEAGTHRTPPYLLWFRQRGALC